MKKRVFSILLALALCLILLPAAAWAEGTNTGKTPCAQHVWGNFEDDSEGTRHINGKCTSCGMDYNESKWHTDMNDDGKCDICGIDLAVSNGKAISRNNCISTWEKAFSHVKNENDLYSFIYRSITNITEAVTLNAPGKTLELRITGNKAQKITVESGTLNLYFEPTQKDSQYSSTVSEIEVKGGTLNVTGNDLLTIEKLTVNGGTVKLYGGTYKEIVGADIKTLLAQGYYAVQTANGTSVQQAPITSVTVSVSNNNAVYGYTADKAPVLTANVTLQAGVTEEVTYQWFENGETTPIQGATGQTYTLPTGLDAVDSDSGNFYGYYCKATVGGCTVTSEVARVTIKKAPALQLPEVEVKQVFSDTAEKTIKLYDYIRDALDDLEEAAEAAATTGNPIGAMQFKGNGYTPAKSIQNGWTVGTETGEITYTIAENQSKGTQITISYKVGFESTEQIDSTYILNHEDAEGKIIITLTGIVPTGTPNYTPITTEGKTLDDVNLNGEFKDGDTVVPGTVEWVLEDGQSPEDVTVVKGQAYKWEFTPNDKENYEGLAGTITPWTENGSGTVIIITPPEQTTDNTTNPATGAAVQPALGLALLAVAAICMDSKLRRK